MGVAKEATAMAKAMIPTIVVEAMTVTVAEGEAVAVIM